MALGSIRIHIRKMNDHGDIVSARTPRLFVDAALTPEAIVSIGPEQTHYLLRVMRLSPASAVTVFNGRDGLWLGQLVGNDRRRVGVRVDKQLKPQPKSIGPWLAFGVPKRHSLETMIQKGTELGVTKFLPIASERSMAERLNVERLVRIAMEAAEQCERLDIPAVEPVMRIGDLFHGWPDDRVLFWCDEHGGGEPFADAADALLDEDPNKPAPQWGLMIGPEGGFAPSELDGLDELSFLKRVTLGPRILRAETAAVVALAIGQALAGDGDNSVRSAA